MSQLIIKDQRKLTLEAWHMLCILKRLSESEEGKKLEVYEEIRELVEGFTHE